MKELMAQPKGMTMPITNHQFKANAGCPCDPCQRLQKRHDIIVFMIQATPAGESAACDAQWREVYKWWDKLAAWESDITA
jgi:hypothetical protein